MAAVLKDHERMAIRDKSAYLQRRMLKKAQQLQDGLWSVEENVNKWLKTITDRNAIVARETNFKSQLWSRWLQAAARRLILYHSHPIVRVCSIPRRARGSDPGESCSHRYLASTI
jgi:hypothetical protein